MVDVKEPVVRLATFPVIAGTDVNPVGCVVLVLDAALAPALAADVPQLPLAPAPPELPPPNALKLAAGATAVLVDVNGATDWNPVVGAVVVLTEVEMVGATLGSGLGLTVVVPPLVGTGAATTRVVGCALGPEAGSDTKPETAVVGVDIVTVTVLGLEADDGTELRIGGGAAGLLDEVIVELGDGVETGAGSGAGLATGGVCGGATLGTIVCGSEIVGRGAIFGICNGTVGALGGAGATTLGGAGGTTTLGGAGAGTTILGGGGGTTARGGGGGGATRGGGGGGGGWAAKAEPAAAASAISDTWRTVLLDGRARKSSKIIVSAPAAMCPGRNQGP